MAEVLTTPRKRTLVDESKDLAAILVKKDGTLDLEALDSLGKRKQKAALIAAIIKVQGALIKAYRAEEKAKAMVKRINKDIKASPLGARKAEELRKRTDAASSKNYQGLKLNTILEHAEELGIDLSKDVENILMLEQGDE